ncbi:MAG: hypothetical protein COY66_01650 [Candidatus Kerfeldbacteria bacterium CG_4_10_14_0_8_um_filter_42_10]|uniref:Glycosyltransferase 2-like domain-containing protein n=1 Tax=Candidatus Kerfeldbacteria bacterium CG_4_10_14_0_8_um_filter_42_10 TaxID=2014248 RepID=A0A2M7RKN1_9BACT|nr:MAG: hypothetical protein COY66_01650 [Candidatus Kerfeldbacteria bacterium CG_4_10_14_0_8_um_filter_42_10]
MSKKVSIILAIYNEEKYLDECIQSLLQQTYPNLEILAIDDGSTDKSGEIIKKYPVAYLHQPHQGLAAVKNHGLRKSTGEILVFADSDIRFDRNYIDELVKPINEGKAIGTFSKEMYVANPENVWSRCYNINLNLGFHRKVPKDFPDEFVTYNAILKKTLLKVGGFDNIGWGEDKTVYPKLKIKSLAVEGAVSYHYNPDTIKEAFLNARWVGRGNLLTPVKTLLRIIKYSLPVSVIIGIIKGIKYRIIQFILFKIIWDLGITAGIIGVTINKKHVK